MRNSMITSAICFFFSFICGVSAFSADYFPLHTGDVRYLSAISERVGEAETVDSLVYYTYYFADVFQGYYRTDSYGRVFFKVPGKEEELRYNPGAEVGESWTFYGNGNVPSTVTLASKTEKVKTITGEYDNCIKFTSTRKGFDGDYIEYFAPGIGLVQSAALDGGAVSVLIKASIGDLTIPAERPSLQVIETVPADGQTRIPVAVGIKLSFSFEIPPSFINSGYIRVSGKKSGPVSGTFTQRQYYRCHEITFQPEPPLSREDSFEVTVSSDIRDYLGDTLTVPYRFSFSTGEAAAVSDCPPLIFNLATFPNPFNPFTTITFSLPIQSKAELAVYSITGQKVHTLSSGQMAAGLHSVVWDGRDDRGVPVSSGVYLTRLVSGKSVSTTKMLLMK